MSSVSCGTLTGKQVLVLIQLCLGDINYDVWYEFTATAAEHIVSVRNQVDVEAEFTVYEGNTRYYLTEVWCEVRNQAEGVQTE